MEKTFDSNEELTEFIKPSIRCRSFGRPIFKLKNTYWVLKTPYCLVSVNKQQAKLLGMM